MNVTQGNVAAERTESKCRGYFCLPRGIMARFRHQGPLTGFEAVAWLVEHAAFTERDVNGVRVQRGEQMFTWHGLARAWAWTKPRAMRFVRRLEQDGLVRVEAYPQAYRLTLCEPLLISGSRTPDRTPSEERREESKIPDSSLRSESGASTGSANAAPEPPQAPSKVVDEDKAAVYRTARRLGFSGGVVTDIIRIYAGAMERTGKPNAERVAVRWTESALLKASTADDPHAYLGALRRKLVAEAAADWDARNRAPAAQSRSRGRSGGVIAGSAEWWETTGALMGYTLPPGAVPPPSAAIEAGTARPVYAARGTAQ